MYVRQRDTHVFIQCTPPRARCEELLLCRPQPLILPIVVADRIVREQIPADRGRVRCHPPSPTEDGLNVRARRLGRADLGHE